MIGRFFTDEEIRDMRLEGTIAGAAIDLDLSSVEVQSPPEIYGGDATGLSLDPPRLFLHAKIIRGFPVAGRAVRALCEFRIHNEHSRRHGHRMRFFGNVTECRPGQEDPVDGSPRPPEISIEIITATLTFTEG